MRALEIERTKREHIGMSICIYLYLTISCRFDVYNKRRASKKREKYEMKKYKIQFVNVNRKSVT